MRDDARIGRGMAVQLGRRHDAVAGGDRPLGWKIGLTAPPVQEQLAIEAPVVGYLSEATRLEPGGQYSIGSDTRVAVEPEVAIHVGPDLEPGGLGAAIEVVDIDLPFEDLEAILAGNVFHRGVVLGEPVANATLGGVEARLERNGSEEATADAATVGDPAAVVGFVADFLEEHGEQVSPGEVIIAGSVTPLLFVEPGDRVRLDLGPLGALELGLAV